MSTDIITTLRNTIADLKLISNYDSSKFEIVELEILSSQPTFWDDNLKSIDALTKLSELKRTIEKIDKFIYDIDIIEYLIESKEEYEAVLLKLQLRIDEFKIQLHFSPEDNHSCIFSITSGAGGREAKDWTRMLMDMYTRWFFKKDFRYDVIDIDSDSDGVKSCSFKISREYAYGYIKSEIGVHRLIRVSPFDANSRRHTSFASVYAYPIYDSPDIPKIKMEDVRVDTFRSSGAGGQHVNKTESAVRMTHNPTGIVVSSQSERSQFFNRQTCIDMLTSKVYEHYKELEEDAAKNKMIEKTKNEFGSQIRSYTLDDCRIKDHRTGVETSNIDSVFQGNIDIFVDEYITKCLRK